MTSLLHNDRARRTELERLQVEAPRLRARVIELDASILRGRWEAAELQHFISETEGALTEAREQNREIRANLKLDDWMPQVLLVFALCGLAAVVVLLIVGSGAAP